MEVAVCRVPYAGAKAGIRFAGGDRPAVLAAYQRALEPHRGIFLTGPDMGTVPADFLDGTEDPVPLWARSHEGLGMDDLATGHGVKAAAEAALAQLGRGLVGATVALEGFGKVGGLLADQEGLDVEELLALRALHGDWFVEHGPREVRPREALFELECDVLVPGARPDSITSTVADQGPA